MSSIRLFDPRIFEPSVLEPRLFDTSLSDTFESMVRRFMVPMRIDFDNSLRDMRLDVTEVDGLYKVRADLPGIKKEDISVRIEGHTVQIDAEAKQEKEAKDNGGKVLRSERWQGAVSRSLTLAQELDDTKATAKFEDGVLILELPKKTTTSVKRLAIQ